MGSEHYYNTIYLGRDVVQLGLSLGDVGVDILDLLFLLLFGLIVGFDVGFHVLNLKLQLGSLLDQVSQFLDENESRKMNHKDVKYL